ncbi:MAG: FAD-dependent oxidoreductase [Paludibacter sp.]
MVKKYAAKVVSIQNLIDGVYTLEFESLGKPFKYDTGQFLHLAIDEYDPSMQWPDSRCFSMQSAPYEEVIRITYAAKGQFTNRMKQLLEVGKVVTLKLPYGDLFSQKHNKTNTVFIAGGTGITPYLSLFTDESFKEYVNPKIYLGFRSQAYNLYQAELDKMYKIRENSLNSSEFVKLVYEDKDGILDIEKILNENTSNSSFFISGPPVMIKNFKQTLINKGVPEQNVLTDDWE